MNRSSNACAWRSTTPPMPGKHVSTRCLSLQEPRLCPAGIDSKRHSHSGRPALLHQRRVGSSVRPRWPRWTLDRPPSPAAVLARQLGRDAFCAPIEMLFRRCRHLCLRSSCALPVTPQPEYLQRVRSNVGKDIWVKGAVCIRRASIIPSSTCTSPVQSAQALSTSTYRSPRPLSIPRLVTWSHGR